MIYNIGSISYNIVKHLGKPITDTKSHLCLLLQYAYPYEKL